MKSSLYCCVCEEVGVGAREGVGVGVGERVGVAAAEFSSEEGGRQWVFFRVAQVVSCGNTDAFKLNFCTTCSTLPDDEEKDGKVSAKRARARA